MKKINKIIKELYNDKKQLLFLSSLVYISYLISNLISNDTDIIFATGGALAIGAGISLLTTGIGAAITASQNKKNREAAEEKAQTQTQEDLLPEETLYEKFIPNKDTALFKTWHSSSWEDKLRLLDKFQDKRCSWFGQKIIYQEAPQILPPDLYKNIKSEIARRILSKNKEKWQTINMAYTEIDYLRDQASNRDDEVELKKLDEINQFIMSIEKKYEFT